MRGENAMANDETDQGMQVVETENGAGEPFCDLRLASFVDEEVGVGRSFLRTPTDIPEEANEESACLERRFEGRPSWLWALAR
jgi:hypothetical protein